MLDIKALAAGLGPMIKQLVSREVGAVEKRLETLSERIDTLPTPKDGQNGKDADPALIKSLVEAAVAQIPVPKDGASVTVDDVAHMIEERVKEAVAAIPAPKDGQDGADGKNAEPLDKDAVVLEVAALIPRPQDGKSITLEEVEPMLASMLEKAVADLPKPKDGESVPVDQVQRMIDEAVTKAISTVPVPKDGEHGRDAAELDILPAINESRRYARGTYASHKGGLWRAMRATDGMDGWECIVEGESEVEIKQSDDLRTFTIARKSSSGQVFEKSFKVPVVIYRGIYREGDDYDAGDSVTWGGSTWIALQETKSKPDSTDGSWKLSVKRGSPGKDAAPAKSGGPAK